MQAIRNPENFEKIPILKIGSLLVSPAKWFGECWLMLVNRISPYIRESLNARIPRRNFTIHTLPPKTNSLPPKIDRNRKIHRLQPSICRGQLAVSFREGKILVKINFNLHVFGGFELRFTAPHRVGPGKHYIGVINGPRNNWPKINMFHFFFSHSFWVELRAPSRK